MASSGNVLHKHKINLSLPKIADNSLAWLATNFQAIPQAALPSHALGDTHSPSRASNFTSMGGLN
tara:strand:+ start:3145 stop:3339 length:195 start_codon:yes stop_codon:yes gene_type:complete